MEGWCWKGGWSRGVQVGRAGKGHSLSRVSWNPKDKCEEVLPLKGASSVFAKA